MNWKINAKVSLRGKGDFVQTHTNKLIKYFVTKTLDVGGGGGIGHFMSCGVLGHTLGYFKIFNSWSFKICNFLLNLISTILYVNVTCKVDDAVHLLGLLNQ